jgi:histidyl-tRNA synthetase
VWRADRPQKGRFREFYQCDVDAIGSTSPLVEAELLAAVCDVLDQLGFSDFTIRLNHRQLLTALLNSADVPPHLHGEALIALDKADKIGRDGVSQELLRRGIDPGVAMRLFNWLDAAYPTEYFFEHVVDYFQLDASGQAAVANLRAIVQLSERTSAGTHIKVEPILARGLSYYTGAIFEIGAKDRDGKAFPGSLGGGGRYDNLVGMFSGQSVPACGFSLGLERILVVMGERDMFPPEVAASGPDVLVALWNDQTAGESLALARDLRSAGLRVEVYPEADKIGKQLKYASGRGARFVTIIGDDERAKGAANVKQLATGEQQTVPVAELAGWLRARL